MSSCMTEQDIDPFAYLGSTIGHAHGSGLTIKELLIAVQTTWDEYEAGTCRNPFEGLDHAVDAMVHLRHIRERNSK